MDPSGWLRAGTVGGSAGPVAPEGGGELRAGRVVGAHEEHALRGDRRRDDDAVEPVAAQRDVAAAMVTLRHAPLDQACRLEHVQVMGRGVGRQRSGIGQLPKGPVTEQQLVDDSEPVAVSERGVDARRARRCASVTEY